MQKTTALRAGAVALASTALAAAPVPALAHDTLLSSTPQDGAAAQEAPQEIELTFSAPPQDVGTQIRVTDAEGADVTQGAPEIQGDAAVQDLAESAQEPGEYTVVWRVVSSDGHPIEGTFDYTVDGGAEDTASASSGSTPSQDAAEGAGSAAATPEEAQGDSSAEESDDDGGSAVTLLVVGGIAVLGAVAAAIVMMRRMSR